MLQMIYDLLWWDDKETFDTHFEIAAIELQKSSVTNVFNLIMGVYTSIK